MTDKPTSVMVPMEPTEAMLHAAIRGRSFPQDFGADYQGRAMEDAARIYCAMLSAAPPTPGATFEDGVNAAFNRIQLAIDHATVGQNVEVALDALALVGALIPAQRQEGGE